MMELKGCPRCHGDMRVSDDLYGEYKQCLQCGNSVEVKPTTRRLNFPTARADKEKIGPGATVAEPAGDRTLFDG